MSSNAQIGRLSSIDAIKGVAILAVLVLHSVPAEWLVGSWAVFHLWQAVPVFLVLLGYTGAMTRVRPLSMYFGRRARRLLPPFLIAFGIALAIGLVTHSLELGPELLLGHLPLAKTPGNYFISLLLQFVILLPLARMLFDRSPWLLLVAAAILEVVFRVALRGLPPGDYFYQAALPRVGFAIAAGMWLSTAPRTRKTTVIVGAFGVVSAVFLVLAQVLDGDPARLVMNYAQSGLAVGVPLVLIAAGRNLRFPAWLAGVGRASYHVLLVQLLWFGQAVSRLGLRDALAPWWLLLISVPLCAGVGYATYRLEEWVFRPRTVSARRPVPAEEQVAPEPPQEIKHTA